MDIYKDKRF